MRADDDLARVATRLAGEVQSGRMSQAAADAELGRQAFERLLPAQAASSSRGDVISAETSELSAVLRRLASLGEPAAWNPAPEYPSSALALIDAIWSIGVRYRGVLNVIARYEAARLEQGADPREDTPGDLVAFIEGCGSADDFAAALANRQRTSSRNGILKAEAVELAARLLEARRVDTPETLRSLDPGARRAIEAEWRAIRGQSSGLSWDYFLMLNGLSGVKADRMIRRFVAGALDRREEDIAPAHAQALIVAASDTLGLDPRVTDFAIWEAMSAR